MSDFVQTQQAPAAKQEQAGSLVCAASHHSLIAGLSADERVRGRYRIRLMTRAVRRDRAPYWRIELCDRSGSMTAYLWPEVGSAPQPVPPGGMVDVKMRTRSIDQLVADIQSIDPVDHIDPTEAIDLLPAFGCPQGQLLDRLAGVYNEVKISPLSRFVGRVLGRDEVGLPFLSAPASIRYHHHWPGGLLEHSLEVAEIVAQLPFDLPQERELAIVAALFHDLAKIWTLDHQLRVTELGQLVSHDHLTLEVCAPALAELESEWPDGALLLRHVWNSASPGARYGVDPRSPVAHAVRLADRYSAERSPPPSRSMIYRRVRDIRLGVIARSSGRRDLSLPVGSM